MAGIYNVTLKIVVGIGEEKVEIVNEENFFPDITFPKMVSIADQFYDLIAKLKK